MSSVVSVEFDDSDLVSGDVRGNAQVIRARGDQESSLALDSLQDQIDALAARSATVTIPTSVRLADVSKGQAVTLTADTEITADAPTQENQILWVRVEQDSTGGWNITWDVMFAGATTELGNTTPDTRYLFGFVSSDLGGTLTWVNFAEKLSY